MRVFPEPGSGMTLAQYTRTHPVAFRYTELAQLFGESAIRTALKSGEVIRVLPNAYVGTSHRDSAVARGSAINAWSSRALVSGRLALHLLEPSIRWDAIVPIVVPYGVTTCAPGWVDVRHVRDQRVSIAPRGVQSVVPEYAVIDAWHREPAAGREELFYEAMWRRVVSARAVKRELDRAPRIAERRKLDRLLAHMLTGATSPLEVLARQRVFRGPEFREFEWQGAVRVRRATRRVDMLHRRAGLAVEFDGAAWHATPEAVKRDRERDAQLLAQGIVTLRFGYEDLTARSRSTRKLVVDLVRSRLEAR